MARTIFYTRRIDGRPIEGAINYDENAFGTSPDAISPWTISVNESNTDLGRLVGFEGIGQAIISKHHLKPDPDAVRAVEITVFRVNDELRARRLDADLFAAFERWLLKRGWRGDIVKVMKFTDAAMVVPIRRFWVGLGFELIVAAQDQWDEHVVKRWR